jgi:drug/metabolite transporter (DMT)-like permease
LDLLPFLSALLSAITHAGWNAAARSRSDSSAAVTATVFMAGMISVPAAFLIGLPPLEAWTWLILGIVFNTTTLRILVAIYRLMPFAMAYPLLRGTIPLAVTGFNLALLPHATPGIISIAGIVMVSAGVILLGFSGHRQEKIGWKPIALAVLGGITAAAYVITDVKGIAATGDPLVYGVSAAIINAIAMPLFLRIEGTPFSRMMKGQLVFGFFASLFSMGSYLFFLIALTHGPIGAASAIRETSVLFALGISIFMLKEKVGYLRIMACVLAFAGAAILRLG